ncbi:lactonase family protein [Horticoccus luteus]|uniref:Lactonase family protein n=1 Tax=Horticoccus luteus TaxID=2862869 RepID=A0A8F9XHG7_9BACT|nr:lactonase family protein [Horticoccus luteus]QYM80227.1 lactonase family protein [Horticoccus luteus]
MTLSASAADHLIFIGTYTRTDGLGIYSTRLDATTGAFSVPKLAAATTNPSFVTLSPDRHFLYAVSESDAMAVPFAVNPAAGLLKKLQPPQPSGGPAPCHLVVDRTGRVLLTANYHKGIIGVLPIRSDGQLGTPTIVQHYGHSVNPERQSSPHTHSVTLSPDNRHVIVCDLGLDRIFTYLLDLDNASIAPERPAFVVTPAGSGPRHFAFGRDGRHAYAICEMGSLILTYDYSPEHGELTPRQQLSSLPADFSGSSSGAEIRVHPNGRFLYGSNRGHDSIAVFAISPEDGRLTLVEIVPCGGKNPRNFTLSPDGRWLVCANQGTNSLTVLSVDADTGRLHLTDHRITVPLPVCVQFYN